MTKLLLTLQILLLALGAAPGVSGADAAAEVNGPNAAEHFSGRYDYAGGVSEERRLRSIVDALVDRFNPLIRGLARHRLYKTIRVPEGVDIASDRGVMSVAVVGAPGFSTNIVFENGTLVQRNENFEGTRTTEFELSPDGMRLTMRVTTRSGLLPGVLSYELSFERDLDSLVGSAREPANGS